MQHVTPLALGKQVGGKPVGWRVREEGGREEGGRREGGGREEVATLCNQRRRGSYRRRGTSLFASGYRGIGGGASSTLCPFSLIPSHRLVWSSTFLLTS